MHNPKLESITTMLNTDNIQHVIPIYQRKFVWAETKSKENNNDVEDNEIQESAHTKDRIDNLFEFIEEIADGKTDAPTNFIGFMVTQTRAPASAIKMNKFQVIDGQQRFTTISLLLIAVSKICNEETDELNKKIEILKDSDASKNENDMNKLVKSREYFNSVSKEIMKDFIFHDMDENLHLKDRLRFVPSRHNIDAYYYIVKNKLLEIPNNLKDDTVVTAFNKLTYHCRSHLKPNRKEEIKKDKLKNLLTAIKSLKVALLELVERDDAQQIFEAINNRGMKLTGFDLIRNDLFTLEAESIALYENKWEPIEKKFRDSFNEEDNEKSQKIAEEHLFNYVRCLLLKDGDYISKNDVFVTFKNKYSTKEAKLKFIELFCKLHNDYLVLANPENTEDRRSALVEAAKRLKNIEFSSPFPLILNLIENNENIEDISKFIRILEIYYVRRQLTNLSVKKLTEIIMKLCKEYKDNRVQGVSLVDWVSEIFKLDQEIEPANKRFYNYPTDLELSTSLKSLDVYTQCSEVVSHVYLTLNEIKMERNDFSPIDRTEQQLDHIMPQKIKEGRCETDPDYNWIKYLDPNQVTDRRLIEVQHQESKGLIGNLTLSGKNPKSSNKIYPIKAENFKTSPFYYTKSITDDYKVWDFDSINKRTKFITDLILDIGFPDINKIKF